MAGEASAGAGSLLRRASTSEMSAEWRDELRKLHVGHNLSSVLNNPGEQEQAGWLGSFTAMFERDDFESAPPIPSVVPPVALEDFDGYLGKHRAALRQFVRNHKIQSHSEVQTRKLRMRRHTTVETAVTSESVRRTQHLASGLAAAVEGGSADGAVEPSASANALSGEALRACMRQVPARFFEESFAVELDEGEREVDHAAYLRQERLSNWLDLVEVTLWSQTTSQAQQFFNALSDLNELNSHVRDTCSTIADLREHIRTVQDTIVSNHLSVLLLKRRKENLSRLEGLLSRVREVRSTIPRVEKLLATTQDYAAALELLGEARHSLGGELAEVHSLRTLHRQINEYEEMIVDQLSDRFVEVCITWGESGYDDDDDEEEEDETLANGDGPGAAAGDAHANGKGANQSQLTLQLLPLVVGLMSARNDPIRKVLQKYRTRIIEEFRGAAKSSVVEALAAMQSGEEAVDKDDAAPAAPGKSLPKQLAALDPPSFLSFLTLVFDSLEMVMKRAHVMHVSFLACLTQVEGQAEGVHDAEGLRGESMQIVSHVCELSQHSVQKLLTLRLAEHERLQLAEFKQLYDKVGTFSLAAEKLSTASTSIELKGALRLSAKRFLGATHERARDDVRRALDSEKWKGVTAPREMQAIVNRLLSGRLSAERGQRDGGGGGGGAADGGEGGAQQRRGARDLLISGKSFRVVGAILPLLDYLEQYLACAQQLSLSSACLPSLLELLRLFNERTNQLVLKMEAKRTARVENITQTTLVLASQALSVVLALMPAMHSVLVSCLPRNSRHYDQDKGQVKLQLDQCAREFEVHREKIFQKFVDMIEALLNECCGRGMAKVDWDARAPSDIKPEEYMRTLTEKIKNMHKSLARYLPPDQLQVVFSKIFTVINARVPELYADVKPKTGVGVSQVRVDLKNLAHCLRLLPGTSGAGDSIDRLANERFATHSSAAQAAAPAAAQGPANGTAPAAE